MIGAPLRMRRLGRSPVSVTELSLGGAAIGNLFTAVDDEAAQATVDAAWNGGIRTFDTAPHYGLGLSERRLGAALRGRPRDQYVISTKVGRFLQPLAPPHGRDAAGFAVPASHARTFDYTADGVLRSLEASLQRLGLDRVDVALIHDPDDHGEQALAEAYPALERLRSEGVVGAIGVGMNQTAMLARFVTDTDIDVVLEAGRFTLLDQSAADSLLPAALERGVGVLAGGVFNSGVLAAPGAGARYDYQAAPAATVARALALQAECARFGLPLRAAAAQFPLRHPAVASVLIGARSPAEITDALHWHAASIPDGLWDAMRAPAADGGTR
ncbi:MAG TPA: aldo/keto reductase [Streptosporangiaceae bacterium]|nr:aldo/keto reductase [Streptosporangiaceae bacterium]